MEFSEEKIEEVWQLATVAPGQDLDRRRKDVCGAWIERGRHGDRTSRYGWEIDHVISPASGGSDELFNLRPLHWENKRARKGGELRYAVTSIGDRNIHIG